MQDVIEHKLSCWSDSQCRQPFSRGDVDLHWSRLGFGRSEDDQRVEEE